MAVVGSRPSPAADAAQDRSAIGYYRRLVIWSERLLLLAAGTVLILMMLHICVEAFLRSMAASISLSTLTVVSAWYMVAVTFLPMPHAGGGPGHLSVDVVAQFFTPRLRAVSRFAVAAVSFLYFLGLGYLTAVEALHQTAAGEMWETSTGYIAVWPGRWVLPVAFFAMALREGLRLLAPGRSVPARAGSEA